MILGADGNDSSPAVSEAISCSREAGTLTGNYL